jgi:acyl-CoA dehydrogenase
MRRQVFEAEHEAFRETMRAFIAAEVVPHFRDWEEQGQVPRKLYRALGDLGVMGIPLPEEFGGAGQDDYRYSTVIQEEAAAAYITLGTLRTHLDIVIPYFLRFADAEQRARWFPGLVTGELYTAIAMTEPGTGSDLAGVRTTATRVGDEYVINGAKTFITGGWHADLVIVLARTSAGEDNRRKGLSLIVVEAGTPGFTKGRTLDKLGLRAQDTVELTFDDVHVPVANRLGDEGEAFAYLGRNLAQERLAIAVGSVAQARAALALTLDYVTQRTLFGTTVGSFQNTKFELAAIAAELEAAQALADRALMAQVAGELTPVDAAKAKLFCTEFQGRMIDRCLQLFGGYGYINEYRIARLYADARVTRIYGGTSEVMKTIISKSLGL